MKISNSNDTLKLAEGLTPSLAEQSRKRRKLMRGLAEQQEHRGPPRNDLSPKLVLEHRPIAELKPATRRLRKNDPLQIDRIRSSIETYGICQPLLITGTGEIVDGHLVIEAAKSLGLQGVPCIVIDHLSPADVRRLRISLNRLAETGTWDFPELKVEIQDLAVEFGETFEIPGLEPAELDLFLQVEDDETAKMAADDAVPAVQQTAVSRLGDIWRLGPHRLGCGDAKDRENILPRARDELRVVPTVPSFHWSPAFASLGERHCGVDAKCQRLRYDVRFDELALLTSEFTDAFLHRLILLELPSAAGMEWCLPLFGGSGGRCRHRSLSLSHPVPACPCHMDGT